MRVFSRVLLIVGVFVFASCSLNGQGRVVPLSSIETKSPIDFSVIESSSKFEKNVFSNSELGISFKLPDCFVASSNSENNRLIEEKLPEMANNRSANDRKMIQDGVRRGRVLLNAVCYSFEGKTVGTNILVFAEPLTPGMTSKQYAEGNKAESFPRPEVTILDDIKTERLGGETFETLHLGLLHNGVPMRQRYFFKTYGNAGLMISITDSYNIMMPVVLESMQSFSRSKTF